MDFNAWCTDKTGGGAIVIMGRKDSPCLQCQKHTVILFFKNKNKNKKDLCHYEISSWNGTITISCPLLEKKGRGKTQLFFLFHFSFITNHYHYYGTIMPNRQPQSTFSQQEKHIQCCYILGRNNGAHEHFTRRNIMYDTAILLAISPEE